MNSSRLKNEGWLFWLAFLLALGFRIFELGASPLTDLEATLALQALHIAQGKAPLLGPQPSYILFTSLLFAIIESRKFMAGLFPGPCGERACFCPLFVPGKIRPIPALIDCAFFFAIVHPGLVALSRQANGTITWAVTFLLFAWGMWRHNVPSLPEFCRSRTLRFLPLGHDCLPWDLPGFSSRGWMQGKRQLRNQKL